MTPASRSEITASAQQCQTFRFSKHRAGEGTVDSDMLLVHRLKNIIQNGTKACTAASKGVKYVTQDIQLKEICHSYRIPEIKCVSFNILNSSQRVLVFWFHHVTLFDLVWHFGIFHLFSCFEGKRVKTDITLCRGYRAPVIWVISLAKQQLPCLFKNIKIISLCSFLPVFNKLRFKW